jgi:hypothetical protein
MFKQTPVSLAVRLAAIVRVARAQTARKEFSIRRVVLSAALVSTGTIAVAGEVPTSSLAPTFEVWASWDGDGNLSTKGDTVQYYNNLSSLFQLDIGTGNFQLVAAAPTHFESSEKLSDGLTPAFSFDLVRDQTHGNLDPILSYGMSVVNNNATSVAFQKIVTSSIVPTITGINQVRAGVSGSAFDKTGNGVAIKPILQDNIPTGDADGIQEIQHFRLSAQTTGNIWTDAGVDVGPSQSFSGGGAASTYTYGPYNLPFQAGPAGTWQRMSIRTRFELSGLGDRASFTGFAEILPVPEPQEWMLMAAGVALIGCVARRRSRTTP